MGLRLDSFDRKRLQREIERIKRMNWRAKQYHRRQQWYARTLAEACRIAVGNQVNEFRAYWFRKFGDENGQVVCPLLGMPISRAESQIDHTPPATFQKLVNDWLALEGIDAESVCATGVLGLPVTRFREPEMMDRWQNYHREHAVLRVVSARGDPIQGCE